MSTYTTQYALRDFTGLARALSDPNRVRILMSLKDNELCVCQLVELLDLASSTVSRHLAVLSQCYLVDSRKDGRWVFYRRAGNDAPASVRAALDWVNATMAETADAAADREKLATILARPLKDICGPNAKRS